MLQRAGRDMAFERGTQLIVHAGVVGATVIVDVVLALRAEDVRGGDVGAACRAITAPGECGEIVDLRTTARCFGSGAPVVVELVGVTQLRVERIHFHWPRPRLVAEQAVHIDIARYLRAAQQLIAWHRALLPVLIFHVQLQQRLRGDLPVAGQRQEIAVAVGMIDIAVDVFACGVDA